jgi:hypothetical protein
MAFPGADRRLSPENAATTKLGNIQSDPLPTLAYADQNPGNDLSGVYLDTNIDANGDVWLYFAFQRDASSTGQVVFEFDANAAPAACDYNGVNLTNPPGATGSAATQNLIANCNPWANRATGDFSFAFDTQGSTVNIVKRIFAAAAGGSWTSTTLDPAVSAAAIAPDGLTGEGVVNLSKTVFPVGGTSCLTTANILPYTITGNSDTADMKDVVLADFTDQVSVSSCGEAKVTKATDPAGKTGTFPYTLSRSDNSALNFDGDTSVTGSVTGDGDSNLITDLKAGTNYSLAEGALDPAWALQTISCTTDETTDDVYPGAADFIVKVSTIADCTITNEGQGDQPGEPRRVLLLRQRHGACVGYVDDLQRAGERQHDPEVGAGQHEQRPDHPLHK